MKIRLTALAIALILSLTSYGQQTKLNSKGTSLTDTNKVCLPIEIARQVAIDLELYDRLRIEVPALDKIIFLQNQEISIITQQRDMMRGNTDRLSDSLTKQLQLTTKWQDNAKKRKSERNIAVAIGVVLVGVLIVK